MNPLKNAVSKKVNKKKTGQGNGTFSKKYHNKRSKGYKKRYRGQGK
jgi:hypothetical protein